MNGYGFPDGGRSRGMGSPPGPGQPATEYRWHRDGPCVTVTVTVTGAGGPVTARGDCGPAAAGRHWLVTESLPRRA